MAKEANVHRVGNGRKKTSTVVVIEDDEDLRDLLRFKLKEKGYDVKEFQDGERAWESLERGDLSPSLVLLDLMIPGMGGYEFLDRINENPKTMDIPVIVLSGLGNEEDVVQGLELGAEDYVTKPFSPEELMTRIKKELH